MTDNKFWKDVIKSLQSLWHSEISFDKDIILNTHLRYNNQLRLQLRSDWLNKGVSTVVTYLISPFRVMLPIKELRETYDMNINFFDYYNLSQKITNLLAWRDRLVENEPLPRNCGINFLLHIDKKGSSKIYRKMKDSNEHILDNICDSLRENPGPELCNLTLSTSFSPNH